MTKYFIETPSGKVTQIIADRMTVIEDTVDPVFHHSGKYSLNFYIGKELIASFRDWVGYRIDYGAVYHKGNFEN